MAQKGSSIHFAVYISTITAILASFLSLYIDQELPFYMVFPLVLLAFAGWIHFLRLVVTNKSLTFDKKMVWFIAIFSLFAVAAPLYLIVYKKQNEN